MSIEISPQLQPNLHLCWAPLVGVMLNVETEDTQAKYYADEEDEVGENEESLIADLFHNLNVLTRRNGLFINGYEGDVYTPVMTTKIRGAVNPSEYFFTIESLRLSSKLGYYIHMGRTVQNGDSTFYDFHITRQEVTGTMVCNGEQVEVIPPIKKLLRFTESAKKIYEFLPKGISQVEWNDIERDLVITPKLD